MKRPSETLLICFCVLYLIFMAALAARSDSDNRIFMAAKRALLSNDTDQFSEIIAEHPDGINATDKQGRTFLIIACGNLSLPFNTVQYLVDEDVEIDVISSRGRTALSIVMRQGRASVIKYLVDQGAEWSISDRSNIVNINELELVKYFVEDGIDIDYQDERGSTALMKAVINNNTELVKYLLENGADFDIENSSGLTALDYAAKKKRVYIENLIKSGGE